MLLTANIFQPLIDVFEAVLKFFHNSVGVPWGFSIVLLTVVIRALLVPLTLKQFSSMQKLQRLQPELKALQAKYKDDKQRQQQELMKFYRENQVNPLGSCLPLVAQLPVFISLFYMLRSSLRIDICPQLQPGAHLVNGHWTGISHAHTVVCGPHGGASFLFVNDLTNKATGAVLVVLIVLYVGTQLGSSLLMSSPTMDQTQRRIMLFMPLFFVVFIISFPAGVIVYWITTNSWTILQQYIVRKRIGPMGPPVTADATAGGGRGGGGGSGGAAAKPAANGAGGGGLAGLLRSRMKASGDEPLVGAGSRGAGGGAPPPPPPRKKKKRSGRRR
jgi:YidC/Oxa1 family membrane protein insertase